MHARSRIALVLVAAALVAGEALATVVALLPVRRGVRQGEVTGLVGEAVARELAARATLVDEARVRDVLRGLRMRSAYAAEPERLAAVAAALGADWLVAAEVHDAVDGERPDLTLSVRLYEGRSGRVAWVGTAGRSGFGGQRLLDLGRVVSFVDLVPLTVAELLAPILRGTNGAIAPPPGPPALQGETLAIVPFTVVGAEDGVEVATAATETLRALLAAAGVELAHPGCVRAALRSSAGVRWGELDESVRGRLREDCDASLLVTGAVERWEVGETGRGPEPVVAVAVRQVDSDSGEIAWAGSLEARGWDREGWFGSGRVYSRGVHLRNLLARIAERMLAADAAARVMKESS